MNCEFRISKCKLLYIEWASQVAQWERIHLPMQQTQEIHTWSRHLEDPLEKEMAAQSSILAWKIPWTEKPGYSPRGCKEWDTTERLSARTHTHTHICRKDKYPVINHNGKECEIECIHTYNWITLLYSTDWHNIVNQIYFNKIKKNFLSHSFIGAPNSVLRTSTWGSQFLPGIPE